MQIEPFLTEQFFTKYEFSAPHLLASSDCETISISELLQLAGSSLEEFGSLTLGYTESQGNPRLRSQISQMYSSIAEEEIVVLTSPVEGIFLAMQTVLEPDHEVIALRPAYDALSNVARHLCRQVVPWHMIPSDGHWALDFAQLESLINDQTQMIVVNFPHNPTGYVPSREEFKRLIQLAEENDIWLFCDEIYRGLEFEERIPSAADLYEKAIVLSGLSKTHGLPGLRAGWLVIRDPALRESLINWKHYTTICPAAPTEYLASQAISVQEQLADRSKQIIRRNLTLCHDFIESFSDRFIWRQPIAGSVAFVELKLELFGFETATDFCHHLAREHGIVLLPGACLGYDDHFVRFGLGRLGFGDALQAFSQVLKTTT